MERYNSGTIVVFPVCLFFYFGETGQEIASEQDQLDRPSACSGSSLRKMLTGCLQIEEASCFSALSFRVGMKFIYLCVVHDR